MDNEQCDRLLGRFLCIHKHSRGFRLAKLCRYVLQLSQQRNADIREGSAVYVYGDQVNDHGYYSVFINDTQMANLTGRSGCAAPDGEKSCEKLGGLHFFAGGLPEGQHDLRIVNGGSQNDKTYFGKHIST
jgi:hypothetical protein